MNKDKKPALDLPRINPLVFELRDRRIAAVSDVSHRGSSSAFEKLKIVDELIAKMPSITKSAGYSLLSKLFTLWMSPSANLAEIEIEWDHINEADDFGLIKSHMQIAKTALEFSLKPVTNLKKPNLAGIGNDFSIRLNNNLNSISLSKNVSPIELTLPVYEIHMNSYNPSINDAIIERLKATKSRLSTDEEILKYNNAFNLKVNFNSPVKNIHIENLQLRIQASQLLAALGRFHLLVFVKINASKTKRGQVSWKVDKIVYQIKDSFDFNEEDYLGHWDVKGLSYPGIELNDRVLREYGKRHNLKAFKFYSEFAEDFQSTEFVYRKNKTL